MIDQFKDKLTVMADDETALMAVEAVFIERIEKEKPEIKDTDNDAVVGQKYRAYEKAKEILNASLNDIKNFKEYKKNNLSFNKAK